MRVAASGCEASTVPRTTGCLLTPSATRGAGPSSMWLVPLPPLGRDPARCLGLLGLTLQALGCHAHWGRATKSLRAHRQWCGCEGRPDVAD